MPSDRRSTGRTLWKDRVGMGATCLSLASEVANCLFRCCWVVPTLCTMCQRCVFLAGLVSCHHHHQVDFRGFPRQVCHPPLEDNRRDAEILDTVAGVCNGSIIIFKSMLGQVILSTYYPHICIRESTISVVPNLPYQCRRPLNGHHEVKCSTPVSGISDVTKSSVSIGLLTVPVFGIRG